MKAKINEVFGTSEGKFMTTGFIGRFRGNDAPRAFRRIDDSQTHTCSCTKDSEQERGNQKLGMLADFVKQCKAIEDEATGKEEYRRQAGEALDQFLGEMGKLESTNDAESEPDPTEAERVRREGKPLNNQPPETPLERAQSHPGQPRSTGNEPEASHTPPALPEAGYGILRNGDQRSAMDRFLAGVKKKYPKR